MYTRSLGLSDCNGDGPVVNERLNAKLSEDTAATAELRQVFKELHTDYGKRRTLSLSVSIERPCSPTPFTRWNSESQP